MLENSDAGITPEALDEELLVTATKEETELMDIERLLSPVALKRFKEARLEFVKGPGTEIKNG